jgi:hypothetical protein
MRNVILSAVAVVLMAGSAPAQGTNPYVERQVSAVETYFATVRPDPRHLSAAQWVLSYWGGAPLEPDGAWGPSTEARVREILTSMNQIGIDVPGTDPFLVTETMIRWITEIMLADVGIGDTPD